MMPFNVMALFALKMFKLSNKLVSDHNFILIWHKSFLCY